MIWRRRSGSSIDAVEHQLAHRRRVGVGHEPCRSRSQDRVDDDRHDRGNALHDVDPKSWDAGLRMADSVDGSTTATSAPEVRTTSRRTFHPETATTS